MPRRFDPARLAACVVFAAVVGASVTAGSARATVISYQITGEVGQVDDLGDAVFGGAFTVGMPFTGTASYDTSMPDVDPDPGDGRYESDPVGSLIGLSMSVGGLDITTNPSLSWGSALVRNDPGAFNDSFRVVVNDPDTSTALSVDQLEFFLLAADHAALSSDNLPTDLDLNDWQQIHTLSFLAIDQGNFGFVFGEIQTLTKVPEPTAGLLLAIGLAMGMRGRRRR
jgi:hypothetical protein